MINMEEKNTSTKKVTTSKASSSAKAKSSKDIDREKKEALRKEVLDIYSKKTSTRPVPTSNVETSEIPTEMPRTEEETIAPTLEDTTPKVEEKKVEESVPTEIHTPTANTPSSPFDHSEHYEDRQGASTYKPQVSPLGTNLGRNANVQTPHKEKDHKFSRFLSYLFTTREGWYYILGTISIIIVIILFCL